MAVVGPWPNLATAVAETRVFLNDGPLDKPVKRKQLVGNANGANTLFQTWEERLVPGSMVVTVDFTQVASTEIDLVQGLIQLAVAPTPGQVVRGRYYYQFFFDSELEEFVQRGAAMINESEDVTLVAPGLKDACMSFAGFYAFRKQAIRWAHRMSDRFLLEEEPLVQEPIARPNHFEQMAQKFLDEGRVLRDDYYRRHSRSLAPAFAVFKPRIPPIAPRR